jgi:phosphopantothenoylcysteine decarboxylase/phosphopantothenate--cysteine ligase
VNVQLLDPLVRGRRVLVCVCGGIAAYKVVETVSLLVQAGAEVRVAMTPEAARFVTPLTFEAISGRPVASDLFGAQHVAGQAGGEMHITLSDWPEAILVAPATANVIARLANGLADEVVTTTVLASAAPLVVAPAMHTRMWGHPATQQNIRILRERGVAIVGPVEGRLASGEVGPGRLADQDELLRAVAAAISGTRDLDGVSLVVSAGGTREALDPVRYIGNRSSGRMGHALAAAAALRGGEVTLVTSSSMAIPGGVKAVKVESAAEMAAALHDAVRTADVLIMAAAVADFRPARAADRKVPKAEMPGALELEPTEDILASLRADGSRRLLRVGFAAETHGLLEHARDKLTAKGLDLIVANDVSDAAVGMGSPDNAVTILGRDGTRTDLPRAPKELIAHQVLDVCARMLRAESAGALVP